MSTTKPAISFDEIIQADRQRRKNEELANEIFGRSRKAKDNAKDQDRKQSRTPSLASRVGVAKRSNSSTSTNVKPPPSTFNPPSRPSSATANIARTNRLATAINNRQQASVSSPAPTPRGPGLSIKGAAGPFTVSASNFAPGTTAADIESALQSIATDSNGAIEVMSCRVVSSGPSVVAEMVFGEKAMADAVIKTFHGQKADGRILDVGFMRKDKREGGGRKEDVVDAGNKGRELFDDGGAAGETVVETMEDVEMSTAAETAAYSDERDRSDRERRERDRDREREPRRDGEEEREREREERNGRGRDERDRERDRDRDSRRYDDRRYERRDDRGSSSRGFGPSGGYDSRGGGPYGNGMGGYPSRGGGMYNDGMGPRGGFRGGYRGFGRGRRY